MPGSAGDVSFLLRILCVSMVKSAVNNSGLTAPVFLQLVVIDLNAESRTVGNL